MRQACCVPHPETALTPDWHGMVPPFMYREDGGLIRAACRHVAEQVGLDLSTCNAWLRVATVTYIRQQQQQQQQPNSDGGKASPSPSPAACLEDPGCREVVVLYAAVPDACVPGPDTWPEEARRQAAFKAQRMALEDAAKKKVCGCFAAICCEPGLRCGQGRTSRALGGPTAHSPRQTAARRRHRQDCCGSRTRSGRARTRFCVNEYTRAKGPRVGLGANQAAHGRTRGQRLGAWWVVSARLNTLEASWIVHYTHDTKLRSTTSQLWY